MDVLGLIVGVLVLAAIGWSQWGALFERRYSRDDTGPDTDQSDRQRS